jgi:hypothetical protein
MTTTPPAPQANPVLFKLGHGDMVTIEWSGEPRLVVADVRKDGTWLRDLTEDEAEQMADEAARVREDSQ